MAENNDTRDILLGSKQSGNSTRLKKNMVNLTNNKIMSDMHAVLYNLFAMNQKNPKIIIWKEVFLKAEFL